MKSNKLEFSFSEIPALVAMIAELNKNGVPYSLRKDAHAIEISIAPAF
jgi:hypothetical protein